MKHLFKPEYMGDFKEPAVKRFGDVRSIGFVAEELRVV